MTNQIMDTGPADPRCAALHIAPWFIWGQRLSDAMVMIRAGTWPMAKHVRDDEGDAPKQVLYVTDGSIAMIRIDGHMMKGDSKFGGTNMLRTRRALRMAASDAKVDAIVLGIDSPGGTVAGTAELADDVRAAAAIKPVVVQIEDLGASAALYAAAHATAIYANQAAMVGSVGVIASLRDTSGKAEAENITVHTLTSDGAEFKAAGADGTPVTPEHLAYFQTLVDSAAVPFLNTMVSARGHKGVTIASLKALGGRVVTASIAQTLGLIDGVQSFDATIGQIRGQINDDRRAANATATRARALRLRT